MLEDGGLSGYYWVSTPGLETFTITIDLQKTITVSIVPCQAHPVLVKAGQMYGSFLLKNFL